MNRVPSHPSLRVMVVDDSAVVRTHLGELLTKAGMAVDVASDPLFALHRLQTRWPDVFVLDVEMPRMDGISFLRQIMTERATPVLVCVTSTEQAGQTATQAMAAGAVGLITKPERGLREFLTGDGHGIVDAVREAARVNMAVKPRSAPAASHRAPATASPTMADAAERVIAVAVSTGGVQTIESVLKRLPRGMPGMLIVQHMPPNFTAALAQRLSAVCELDVREACHGDLVMPGRVLIAPGGRHMRLQLRGGRYTVEVFDGPLVKHLRPNADVLMRSVAQHAGARAIGVVLTGMGDDGAEGLLAMRQAGAHTAAQDEASCVVYGMPKEAARMGAAEHIVSLQNMPNWLLSTARTPWQA